MDLLHIFKNCAQQGLIVSTQACLTPIDEGVDQYWKYQVTHRIYHWYSLQNHAHILELLLELHLLGYKSIAKVCLIKMKE